MVLLDLQQPGLSSCQLSPCQRVISAFYLISLSSPNSNYALLPYPTTYSLLVADAASAAMTIANCCGPLSNPYLYFMCSNGQCHKSGGYINTKQCQLNKMARWVHLRMIRACNTNFRSHWNIKKHMLVCMGIATKLFPLTDQNSIHRIQWYWKICRLHTLQCLHHPHIHTENSCRKYTSTYIGYTYMYRISLNNALFLHDTRDPARPALKWGQCLFT